MLTTTTRLSDFPFILEARSGTVTGIAQLQFCLVNFEPHAYHDGLFEHYGLRQPLSIRSAVNKRRAEYLAGRYGAQQLLRGAGCREAVTMGADRAPLWPPGWRGSISHTNQWAIAVISPASTLLRPGVDIEAPATDALRDTVELFVTPQERAVLAANGIEEARALLIAFSVKESLYKSLYPLVQRFFGFEAAEIVRIEPQRQRVTLRLTETLTPQLPAGLTLFGYYQIRREGVVTLVV